MLFNPLSSEYNCIYFCLKENNNVQVIDLIDKFSEKEIDDIRKNEGKALYSVYHNLVYDGNDFLFLYSDENLKYDEFTDIICGLIFIYSDKINGKLSITIKNNIGQLTFLNKIEPLLLKTFIITLNLDEELLEYLI
jgi:hypothetical protein